MKESAHSFSVFYLTQSVFKKACIEFIGGEKTASYKFLLNSVVFHTRYRNRAGIILAFAPIKLVEWAKSVQFENNFTGFMALGNNMFDTVNHLNGYGSMNEIISDYAIDKAPTINGDVKIICDDKETELFFDKKRTEDDCPYSVISSEEALKELQQIHEKLKGTYFPEIKEVVPESEVEEDLSITEVDEEFIPEELC